MSDSDTIMLTLGNYGHVSYFFVKTLMSETTERHLR